MKPHRKVVAVVAMALLVAACGGRSGTGTEETARPATTSTAFGDLSAVCGPGTPSSAPAHGVTAKEVKVGVFTDVGFTKKPELVDAAKVFTEWCNAAGGINGRRIVAETRDTKMMEVRQRMLDACREDFALVGGSASLDGLGVKDRLSCLLPEFSAQVSQPENIESDLQINASPSTFARYEPYFGLRQWLFKEAYPQSAGAVGVINGDSPVTKVLGAKAVESITAAGGTVTYNELYPAAGVSDWTPYAQSIKSKGVRGLLFLGSYAQLAKLEDVLTGMDYKLDWIDANNNAYNQSFVELLGRSADYQNNLVDLGGVVPFENQSVAAMRQLHELYKTYAPDAEITMPALRAFSSWLLFAKAASSCGDALTRKCVVDAATKETAWTGGGLHTANDLSSEEPAPKCFSVLRASSQGWKPADFAPNQDGFRCGGQPYRYTGNYPAPMTLADVGKSMSDLK
ncbi:ABC transporter substrate-binding protein [Nocardia fluminea]|uniref:ABC transporter substrate-binding protein n=1 Tax=Nocardia fluminea TaxID=134984 RepID=UPI003823C438